MVSLRVVQRSDGARRRRNLLRLKWSLHIDPDRLPENGFVHKSYVVLSSLLGFTGLGIVVGHYQYVTSRRRSSRCV